MQTKYPPNVLSEICPSRQTLEIIADKWATLVLVSISRGINRHNRMLREIGGISKKMLAQTLRKLEQNGIINRRVYPVVPPMVEYTLTPIGKELMEPISMLGSWAERNSDAVQKARESYIEKENSLTLEFAET
ncbi:MAG: helix-turn-helix transcriptional regulator [Anaerolineales bacterium]|nr:helix-turn-helix transcriptional regulator [Anaerolineales bacterium]MCB9145386.1 helix-turn-helix transcriptional regulator [Anaerolineales bacterium]